MSSCTWNKADIAGRVTSECQKNFEYYSSKRLDPTLRGLTLLAGQKEENPLYHDWLKVYLPYQSGDLYLGNYTAVMQSGSGARAELHLRGAHIVSRLVGSHADLNVLDSGELL